MTEHAKVLLYFADNDCSCDADFVRAKLKYLFNELCRLYEIHKKTKNQTEKLTIATHMYELALQIKNTIRIPYYTLHLHQLLQHYVKGLVTNEIKDAFIDYINRMPFDSYIKSPFWKHIKTFVATKMKHRTLGKLPQTSTLHLNS